MAPPDPLTTAGLAAWLDPPLWGMVHLPALPGSPGYTGDADAPLRRALADARALTGAGFAGIMVENYGDLPFFRGAVPPVTVAALARVVGALRQEFPETRLGVNMLRNDAAAAMSIAAACGADAIRVNVHCGAVLADQGLIQGEAAATLRLRQQLGAPVRVLADLRVKHAAPLGERPLVEEALDLRERGLADALLVTGPGTGRAADPGPIAALREALPGCPLLVASGVDAAGAAGWRDRVDGAIVGSDLMHGGRAGAGVDPARAAAFLRAWAG